MTCAPRWYDHIVPQHNNTGHNLASVAKMWSHLVADLLSYLLVGTLGAHREDSLRGRSPSFPCGACSIPPTGRANTHNNARPQKNAYCHDSDDGELWNHDDIMPCAASSCYQYTLVSLITTHLIVWR